MGKGSEELSNNRGATFAVIVPAIHFCRMPIKMTKSSRAVAKRRSTSSGPPSLTAKRYQM